MKNPWRNITVKYISFLMVISIIPLLAIGLISYQTSSRVLQEEDRKLVTLTKTWKYKGRLLLVNYTLITPVIMKQIR